MIIVEIFNQIVSFLPESVILAATIFSKMGTGTQSGKLLFKGICSDTNISISEDATSVKICDTTTSGTTAIATNRIVIGHPTTGITGSEFFVNSTWNSVSPTNSAVGMILSNVEPATYGLYNMSCSVIIGGRDNCNSQSSCATIIGGQKNHIKGLTKGSIFGGYGNLLCVDGGVILGGYKTCMYFANTQSYARTPSNLIISSNQVCLISPIESNSIIAGMSSSMCKTKLSSSISSRNFNSYAACHTTDISGYKNEICSPSITSYTRHNTTIASTGNKIKEGSNFTTHIATKDSCSCESQFSAIIGGYRHSILSSSSSSIFSGYYNSIKNSCYSSIIGSCYGSIYKSKYSTIISSAGYNNSQKNYIFDSKNSSIIFNTKSSRSLIKSSKFSTIMSSQYGRILNSAFSFLSSCQYSSNYDIDDSQGIFMIRDTYSSVCKSDYSMMIVDGYQNKIFCNRGSGLIATKKSLIYSINNNTSYGKNNFILGAYKSWICEDNPSGSSLSCNNFVNGYGVTIFNSKGSNIVGSCQVCITNSAYSSVIGSKDSTIVSSTSSVIIGAISATISGSINSIIVATQPGKTIYDSSNTTRTGHLKIIGSASVFSNGSASFGISTTFTSGSITSITVCNGFIMQLS